MTASLIRVRRAVVGGMGCGSPSSRSAWGTGVVVTVGIVRRACTSRSPRMRPTRLRARRAVWQVARPGFARHHRPRTVGVTVTRRRSDRGEEMLESHSDFEDDSLSGEDEPNLYLLEGAWSDVEVSVGDWLRGREYNHPLSTEEGQRLVEQWRIFGAAIESLIERGQVAVLRIELAGEGPMWKKLSGAADRFSEAVDNVEPLWSHIQRSCGDVYDDFLRPRTRRSD